MKLIKPDFNASVEIEGITGPVPRPVSVDQSITSFERLRTLRVYRFAEGVPVYGHAEEDEVFLVLLSGSVELKLTAGQTTIRPMQLDAACNTCGAPCAAYLPPQGEYRLVPIVPADVAYVRARPHSSRTPRIFPRPPVRENNVVLDEANYAEILRLRIALGASSVTSEALPAGREFLAHIQAGPDGVVRPAAGAQIPVSAWDTLAFHSEDSPAFEFPEDTSRTIFIFSA